MRTGGGGFEGQGRRKHACFAAYPVAISPSPYSGSSVFMFISCLCTCMHLPPCVLKKSLLFASPQHACSAASSRLCFRLRSSGRVRTRNWCVHLCAHLSLSLPLSLSTCEYIPALTYTHTHIKNVKGRLQTRGHTRIHSFHGT